MSSQRVSRHSEHNSVEHVASSPLMSPENGTWLRELKGKKKPTAKAKQIPAPDLSDVSPIPVNQSLSGDMESSRSMNESRGNSQHCDYESISESDTENIPSQRKEKTPEMLLPLSDNDDADRANASDESGSDVDDAPQRANYTHGERVDKSMRDSEDALSNEGIAKLLAFSCGCGKDCTGAFTRNEIHIVRSVQITATEAGTPPAEYARQLCNLAKESSIMQPKPIFNWHINTKPVCEPVFRMAHGLSMTAFTRGRRASQNGCDEVPKKKKKKTALNTSAPRDQTSTQGSERGAQTIGWIKEWIDLHGCKMPDSDLVYVDDVPLGDLSHECATDLSPVCEPVGERQFRRLWQENFAVWCKKRARKPFGTCTVCAGYKARIAKHARDRNELARLKSEYSGHLAEIKKERQIYYEHRRKALVNAAISIIVDGMDQSKLTVPHHKLQPKDTGSFLETKITGVLVHGKCFDAYVSEPQVRHDTNLNLTCIHTTLMKVLATYPDGNHPRVLYVQVDGGSENKNKWMLAYLSLLVEAQLFDKVKMSFLPVGHTHEDIDQAFSRIAVHLNKHDAVTYDAFLAEISKSFKKDGNPPAVISLGAAFDFKTWLDGRLVGVSEWTDNLVYRFSMNPTTKKVEMHYKFLAQSPRYFSGQHDHPVRSFKELERAISSDADVWVKHAGIEMGVGVPSGVPTIASAIDFSGIQETTNTTGRAPRFQEL